MNWGLFIFIAGAGLAAWAAPTGDATGMFESGIALAREGKWMESRQQLERGERQSPNDKRFPIELAGVAFRTGDYETAKRHLRRALELDSNDEYSNDAIGSLLLITGELEAALVYWNRIGRPRLNNIDVKAPPTSDRALMLRAVRARPGSILSLNNIEESKANLARLDQPGPPRLELVPASGESYDLKLISDQQATHTILSRTLPVVARLPYQTLAYSFRLVPSSAARLDTAFRWDSNKQLARLGFSAVPDRDPRWRYSLVAEATNENWDVRYDVARELRLRIKKAGFRFELERGIGARMTLRSAVDVSTRLFEGTDPRLQSSLFQEGLKVKQATGANFTLFESIDQRFRIDSKATLEVGRVLQGAGPFASAQVSATAKWLRGTSGRPLEIASTLSAGRTFGDVPFDELFNIAMERDSSLWLRGHVGTHEGKKGNAPLGEEYLLWNSDAIPTIYRNELFRVGCGPFLDLGKVSSRTRRLGGDSTFVDVGVESRFQLAKAATVVVVYGRDTLRGTNVVYTAIRPR